MKNLLLGGQTTALVLISLFAFGMYKGQVASASQACVEHVQADYVTQLSGRR